MNTLVIGGSDLCDILPPTLTSVENLNYYNFGTHLNFRPRGAFLPLAYFTAVSSAAGFTFRIESQLGARRVKETVGIDGYKLGNRIKEKSSVIVILLYYNLDVIIIQKSKCFGVSRDTFDNN